MILQGAAYVVKPLGSGLKGTFYNNNLTASNIFFPNHLGTVKFSLEWRVART